MTREEFDEQYPNPNNIGFEDAYDILEDNSEKYIASLEQRIAELESPRSCEGCKYAVVDGYDCIHWSSKQEDCCIRFNNPTDYYEPKDNK